MENRFRRSMRFIPTYVGHTIALVVPESDRAVHPHIRGAYMPPTRNAISTNGSSPHTWGIRYWYADCPVPGTVHPHIRGAYVILLNRSSPKPGSSPHTWGIPADELPGTVQALVHPHIRGAYGVAERVQPTQSVHPHIRGAYRFWASECSCRIGSSPHTWGIHRIEPECQLQDRFIPTYVGHSGGGVATVSYSSVHPHIRGAYLTTSTLALSPSGSSPHTWGILLQFTPTQSSPRFIPTYVGHTKNCFTMQQTPPVHPHIRGAYLSLCFQAAHIVRFIPTYVGHTSWRCSTGYPRAVHPHIRGAYSPHHGGQVTHHGSSPHTWGIQF